MLILPNSRRGQVTIFVILGIIILVGVVLAFILLSSADRPVITPKDTRNIEPFESYIKNCLEASAKKSALQLALNSYYSIPVDSTGSFAYLNSQYESSAGIGRNMVRYYVDKGVQTFPTKAEVEDSYSKLLSTEIDICLQGLNDFEEQGYTYTMQPKVIKVEEGNGKIIVKMELQTQVTYNAKEYSLTTFTSEVRYPFYEKYMIISSFVNKQKSSQEYLELGYLANLAYSNTFKWEAYYLGEKITLIKLIFSDAKEVLGKEMVVPFAVRTS